MGILVAPTEPALLKKLGVVSGMPERYGTDFLWSDCNGQLAGVQRKEISDFLASLRDGRIHKEVGQMQALGRKLLVIEGIVRWTNDGKLMHEYVDMGQSAMRKLLFTVRSSGVWVERTERLQETAEAVEDFYAWTQRPQHRALSARPGPVTSWGKANNADYQMHVLTSFPGVGHELAKRIIDKFGGVPLSWDVGVDELMEVEGIGKVKAKRLMEALEHD